MNAKEVTLAVLIDYSKAFDTIDHTILVKKLISLDFDKKSVMIIMNYLTNRRQFVQIEDKASNTLPIHFGVPQGSILGPILFNLYVAELPNHIESESIQYADDTTIYRHCDKAEIVNTIKAIENDVRTLSTWSGNNGLVFNKEKLQFIIFAKENFSLLSDRSFLLRPNAISIKQEQSVKLLGLTLDQNLRWTNQVNITIKSSYSTLQVLKRFKRFTPFKTRKMLAESLILSKLNYCNIVYGQLPKYMLKRLQRVQTCAASYVKGNYTNIQDVINLKWIPVEENINFNIAKLAFQALNDPGWPSYLPLATETRRRNNMRSEDNGVILERGSISSLQAQVSLVFNDLPKTLRECNSKQKFCREAKNYFLDKALAKTL